MPLPTIKAIRTQAVLAPMANPITTAVGTIPNAPLVLIDLETDQGITGRSYLFTYTPLALQPVCSLLDNISDMLAGKAVAPLARFAEMEGVFRLLGRQGLAGMAISGVDMALWDALARSQNLPVASLLGADCDPVRCYDSFGMFDAIRDRDAIESSMEQGFRALKIKIGGSLEDDVRALRSLREITGPEMHLMVDYNQSLNVPEAIRRIHHLEAQFDLTWVEEPVLAEDLAGHRKIREKVKTPIQSGENWWFPEDAARAMQASASDHAMLDIMKIGGVTGWIRASAMAQGASLPVSSHLFIEASAHVMAATANTCFLEHLDVASRILIDPYEVRAGAIVPKGPGFGMEWDHKAVTRYAYF